MSQDKLSKMKTKHEIIYNAHLDGSDFFWKSGDIGILLIHGFTATPSEIKPLARILHEFYPNAPIGRCKNVAYAIMSMAYGSSSMIWFGFDRARLPEIRSLAKTLVKTLET